VLLVLLAAGCASTTVWNPTAGGFHDQRKQRDDEVARRFTSQRDNAEFQAALERWNQQDIEGCREQLQRLLARNPDHCDARLLMADVLLASRQPQEALKQVQEAAKKQPESPDVHYALGLMLDSSGAHREALPHYERATKAMPDNEVYAISYEVAQAAADGGKKPASPAATLPATTPPAKAAEGSRPGGAGPADTAGKKSVADRLDQGYAALGDGSAAAALAYFRQAIAASPENPNVPIAAATAALRRNQPQVAIEVLTPATKRFPRSAAIQRTLGITYYRLGDYKSSQHALQQALSLDKSNALAYFLMGCTLAKLGQFEAADAHWRQAQSLDPRYAVPR
jgi:tetratricopeptide (TPR) repeat protein